MDVKRKVKISVSVHHMLVKYYRLSGHRIGI